MKRAIYPGSFDPITNGHVSIIKRGLEIFDEVVVAVAINPEKKCLFTIEERMEMIHRTIDQMHMKGLRVDTFNGLLVDYVPTQDSNVILRGLRALSDFEYEFQLALMNRKLNRKVQSVFLMTDYKWFYVSSTIIKEAAALGGDINGLVPRLVRDCLAAKYPLLKKRLEKKFKKNRT
ncbi:pantetheine-phosphate adenylyltransferase [Dethiosulfatarculus sandiegensis]|uniref:Phosphopantetheine adenylyltransferase n=1 Tax=Dethiosulfatarculus sandiegensis TaxID=1429043 RepID=A0A0D2J8L9_9BACT|nr:pantetheine-phosphate adenylyltransferase [Dethiosulfatarculus sandiegensis]KIX12036.1 phosphopantetheine adenylyltransferase [Dethiosulfatarculus sandiegensis]